jgi:hypothetical protein
MATPTSPETRLHARGFKKGATWGTAVALGATDEVLLNGNSGLQPPTFPIIPAKESDHAFIKEADFGNQDSVEVAAPIDWRYEMGAAGRILALLFGTAGAPSDLTGAYKHTLQWKDEISGLFGTWVEERAGKIFEVASAKPYKAEFSFTDALLKAVLSMRGDSCINTSAVNTATQIDALTLPASFLDTRMRFKQATVKMNAESGGDVSSESALQVNDFNVSFERPIEGGIHAVGSEKIIEPLEEGHSGGDLITVNLSFPRMNATNAAFFATFLAETEQKMEIKFTGALITGALYYDIAFYFPRLRMKQPTFDAEEIVKGGLELIAEEAASTPTGMSYARPYIEIVNLQTTDYLA